MQLRFACHIGRREDHRVAPDAIHIAAAWITDQTALKRIVPQPQKEPALSGERLPGPPVPHKFNAGEEAPAPDVPDFLNVCKRGCAA